MSISESGIDFKAEFIQQFSDSNAREGLNKSTDHAPESLIDAKE